MSDTKVGISIGIDPIDYPKHIDQVGLQALKLVFEACHGDLFQNSTVAQPCHIDFLKLPGYRIQLPVLFLKSAKLKLPFFGIKDDNLRLIGEAVDFIAEDEIQLVDVTVHRNTDRNKLGDYFLRKAAPAPASPAVPITRFLKTAVELPLPATAKELEDLVAA